MVVTLAGWSITVTFKTAFPIALMVQDFCAAAVYLAHGDTARAGYWISAGMITFFTLLM